MKLSNRQLGIIQALLSGTCYGFLGLLGKNAYEQGLSPGELLSLRFLIGGSLLALFLLLRSPRLLRVSYRELMSCAALGILGYAVFSSCFFTALQGLSSSMTVLLLYTYPILVTAGAWIFLNERIPPQRWIAIPIVIAGLGLLIWGDFTVSNWLSFALGLGSALFYSIYILVSSRVLRDTNPWAAVTYIQLAAGLALGILHLHEPARLAPIFLQAWPTLIAIGVVCTAVAMSLFLAGLKKLKNWEISMLSTAEPVSAIFLAVIFLNETLGWMQIVGALAILSGLVFVSMPVRAKS